MARNRKKKQTQNRKAAKPNFFLAHIKKYPKFYTFAGFCLTLAVSILAIQIPIWVEQERREKEAILELMKLLDENPLNSYMTFDGELKSYSKIVCYLHKLDIKVTPKEVITEKSSLNVIPLSDTLTLTDITNPNETSLAFRVYQILPEIIHRIDTVWEKPFEYNEVYNINQQLVSPKISQFVKFNPYIPMTIKSALKDLELLPYKKAELITFGLLKEQKKNYLLIAPDSLDSLDVINLPNTQVVYEWCDNKGKPVSPKEIIGRGAKFINAIKDWMKLNKIDNNNF